MKYYIFESMSVLEEDDNGVYTEELINGTRRPLNSFDAQSDVMQEVTKERAARFFELKRKRVAERNLDSRDCGTGSGGSGGGDVGPGRVES